MQFHYMNVELPLRSRTLPVLISSARMTISGLWNYINKHNLQHELGDATLAKKTVVVDASIWCACSFRHLSHELTLVEQAPSWPAREEVPGGAERPQAMVRARTVRVLWG